MFAASCLSVVLGTAQTSTQPNSSGSQTTPALVTRPVDEKRRQEIINLYLAYLAAIDEYVEMQELPSGRGCADVVFIPRKGSDRPAMVVELKYNQSAEGAIAQIHDRQYPDLLRGLAGDILLVGVNYDKKNKKHECVIEEVKKDEPLYEPLPDPLYEPHIDERRKKIKDLIQANPTITKVAMAKVLEVSLSTIKRELKSLGIRFVGSAPDGHWEVP